MASIVKVEIHSETSEFPTEKRYDVNTQVSELKKKLELITGANHQNMEVCLWADEKMIAKLCNNDATLASYLGDLKGQNQALKLVVKDEQSKDLLSGDVPKYTISEEKYAERKNNAREFIKQTRQSQALSQ